MIGLFNFRHSLPSKLNNRGLKWCYNAKLFNEHKLALVHLKFQLLFYLVLAFNKYFCYNESFARTMNEIIKKGIQKIIRARRKRVSDACAKIRNDKAYVGFRSYKNTLSQKKNKD